MWFLLIVTKWKDSKHNLLNLLPDEPAINASLQAGPSRPRSFLPSRTTRRKAHEQSELLAHVVAPAAKPPAFVPSAKGKGKVGEELHIKVKGKGKAPAEQSLIVPSVEDAPHAKGGKRKVSDVTTDMLPPPVPDKRSRGSRRVTMDASVPQIGPDEEVGLHSQAPNGGKAKRRGRISLPDLPTSTNIRTAKRANVVSSESASPVIEASTSERLPSPSPIPTTASLPTSRTFLFPSSSSYKKENCRPA